MARILIVEDHPVVRKGYVALMQRMPELEICGEATTAEEALELLPDCDPDLMLVDVSLPGEMSGIDLLRMLKEKRPNLPILVVSGNEEAVYGEAVLDAGAWAYVMKGNAATLLSTLRELAAEVENSKQNGKDSG